MSSTPIPAARRWSWVLLVVAVAAAGAAGFVWLRQRSEAAAVVLDVSTEVADSAPATIPLLIPPIGGDADTAVDDSTITPSVAPAPATPAAPTSSVPTSTVPARSPLSDLLGPQGSAIPPDIEPRVRPRSLRIPAIDVDDPVRAIGLEDDGQLEIPDETEIGWYRYGAAPGLPGATVLAAHVTWNRTTGPFFRLGDVDPGDRVEVTLDDGSRRVYEVVERTMYDKDELPRGRIWRNSGPESLVLITCGGDYNPDIRRYRQNIVVYAVPVEMLPEAAT